jgi:predicted esterase
VRFERLACAVALLGASCAAQVYTPGPQVLSFFSDVDDSDQPYGLYLPKSFDAAKKYPLVVSLHGAWSNHRLNLRRVFGRGNRPAETDAQASRYFPAVRDVEFIVASPYARGTMGYQGIPEKDVYDVVADVKRRFPIDEDRVYLTGLSMGGGGALWLGLTRPDVWAAVAPVCPAVPDGTDELAPNALNLAVHLFHGDQDPAVPVDVSRRWHKELLNLGVNAAYIEYPGVRHNSWDFAYRDGAIFDWFAKFRRVRYPERVRLVSRAYRYGSAYWVRLDGLRPGTAASIDAAFTEKNRITVATANLDGFTLAPAGHPRFARGAPVSVTVDGTAIRTKGDPLSFTRTEKGWRAGRFQPGPAQKRPGAEGPIAAAVASRHVYVYGTADAPPPEVLEERRQVAATAAAWSAPRVRLSLAFTAQADKDVSAQDLEDANLVLFGTKETNRLIARFAPQLPLALNPGAADYGLVFVAPAGKRYVVVNSGLPWWTGADTAKRGDFRFMPPAYRVLLTFGDYILFKGSLENVVAEGLFDRNWKAPAEAAAKMRETGTVVIQ